MGRRGLRGQQSEVSTLQELLGVKEQKLGEEGSEGPGERGQHLARAIRSERTEAWGGRVLGASRVKSAPCKSY